MGILLIIIGIIIVALSYFLSETILERKKGQDTEVPAVDEEFVKKILQENEEKIKESIKKTFEENAEKEIIKADDQMSHISNEKIMAVSEFSDQLLEKIEQNHKEVVFLYDMLNEKENEMKEFVQEIDKSKVVLEELANKELEKQKMLQHKRIQKELEKQLKRQQELEEEKMDLLRSGVLNKEADEEKVIEEPKPVVETQVSALERMGVSLETVPQHAIEKEDESQKKEETSAVIESMEGNQNQAILDMYNQGNSIMEIAKMLGKGQGEVKLVIDLFQGAGE